MKQFNMPEIKVVTFDSDELIVTSGRTCWEVHECQECYTQMGQCGKGYSCTGLICPGLFDL